MGFSFCRADVRHGAGKFAVGRIPETLKPGDERLIVVRTGVCDGGLGVEVGAVVVAVAECELENCASREICICRAKRWPAGFGCRGLRR